MSKGKHRYDILHRFASGLTVFCVVLTVIGGFVAGASAIEITFRSAIVAVSFMFAESIAIKIWASWEDIQQGAGVQGEE